MRVIFYAEPIDENQKVKTVADKESIESRWMNFSDFAEISKKKLWRASELLDWATYIENGGWIYPLSVFSFESDPILDSQVPFRVAGFEESKE